jgi:hypothetical protein
MPVAWRWNLALSIASTCQWWRKVVLGSSRLWNTVHLTWHAEAAKTFLPRAGAYVALDLVGGFSSHGSTFDYGVYHRAVVPNPRFTAWLVDPLLMERVRSLTVAFHGHLGTMGSAWHAVLQIRPALTNLVHLEMLTSDDWLSDSAAEMYLPDPTNSLLPSVGPFYLRYNGSLSAVPRLVASSAHLTELHLERWITIDDFRLILHNSPALVHLTIAAIGYGWPFIQSSLPIQAHSLHSLALGGVPRSYMGRLLETLQAPHLTELALCMVDDPGLPADYGMLLRDFVSLK